MSLDANLLDPGQTVSEYHMASFTGNVDFRLDSSYTLPANAVHVFTLQSQAASESTPTKIFAAYLGDTTRIATDTVILYCHGYSHHMDFYYPRTQLLANVGGKNRYGVMMLDYRGFGASDGSPTEEGIYADVQAVEAWLKSHGLTNDRFIMYGFSLGCAPAVHLTAHPGPLTPVRLLIESPFASPETLAQDAALLAMPGSFVTSLSMDNAEEIRLVGQPLFWVHGVNDQFINIATNGEVVYKNYRGSYSEAHRIPGADHSTIPQTWGFRNYADSVLRFLTR
jgi:pimeloyl-ACP methyl ester carboxylesterase